MAVKNLLPLNRGSKISDKEAVERATKSAVQKKVVRGGKGILTSIQLIKQTVESELGHLKGKYRLIREEQDLIDYIDKCIEYGYVAIDTETEGLDPMKDKIAGVCMYMPLDQGVYIPINHVDYIDGSVLERQVPVDIVKRELDRLEKAKVKIIMHNAFFDIRVIRHQVGSYLTCYWDTLLGAKMLNENENSNGLKVLYSKHVEDSRNAKFNDVSRGVLFTWIPLEYALLYAAHDPYMTFKLFEYQEPYLDCSFKKCKKLGLQGLSRVFNEIEMPCVEVLCDMADEGIKVDREYQKELSIKYHKELDTAEEKFYSICEEYSDLFDKYENSKLKTKQYKGRKINIGSPTQLAILLYDILRLKWVDPKNQRGTGDDILEKLNHPIVESIREYRNAQKLLGTYIDGLDQFIDENDVVHPNINQRGAKTGRISINDPALQTIPSHNKDIRKLYIVEDDECWLSSDYSGQEVRISASESNDKKMIQAYIEGRDLYSEVASIAFNVPYEQCCEFDKDGNKNPPEYKERRSQAKAVVLGCLYSKGVKAIGEDLKIPKEKAQEVYDKVMKSFPDLNRYLHDSVDMAYELGYVTTHYGSRRRLPEMLLDKYEFSYTSKKLKDKWVDDDTAFYYWKRLDKAWGDEKKDIIAKAKSDGIKIIDNSMKIAEATRQCVNARIQGSAVELTKSAMVMLHRNKEFKKLGGKIIMTAHDEIIAKAPKKNALRCGQILSECMVKAGEEFRVPFVCDTEFTDRWFGKDIKDEVERYSN